MTETKRRIRALKKQLPAVKGKVAAMAVSLLLAVTMLTSVSFAWYTLSASPEAGNITTTVASNGNLEIALAGRYDSAGNLLAPLASGIADSFAAEGANIMSSNLTWGNLINLSSNYGIENLVLRPATLDIAGSNAFLSSKIYNADGRVEDDLLDFGFTQWGVRDQLAGTYDFLYKASQYYGVRAISSVTYPDGKGELEIKMSQLDTLRKEVEKAYADIYENEAYIATIQDIVQIYLDANIKNVLEDVPMATVDCTSFVEDLYNMLNDFNATAIHKYGDMLARMATIQTGVEHTRESLRNLDYGGVTPDIKTDDRTPNNPNDDIALAGLDAYIKLENLMNKALSDMVPLVATAKNQGTVTWDDMESILFSVIGIESVTVNGKTVDWLMTHKSELVGFITGMPSKVPIVMNSGAFFEFEKQCGSYMYAEFGFSIGYSFINLNKTAAMRTSAAEHVSYYRTDYDLTYKAGGNVKPSNKVAADTYGMVLDIWVRTNAQNSILTLDGLVQYNEKQVPRVVQVLVYDENGNSSMENRLVWFYIVERTQTNEAGEEEIVQDEYLVYEDTIVDEQDYDSDGNTTEEITVYRSVSSRAVAYITDDNGAETPTERLVTKEDVQQKFDIEIEVVGFGSSNRVDEDYGGMLLEGELSPTQGSGSCYIFYANNPDEAANTLKMLSYLKFAFVDANNNLLAEGKLNVDFAYSEGGKYTVPVVITYSNCTYTALDGAGKETSFFGITELKQNEATLISVVVYLEGSGVDNSMVLSGETVSGSLNIQFASTQNLEALGNTDLSLKYLALSAQINGKAAEQLTYNGTKQGLPLTATVEGVTGSRVEAVFQRMINATQGSKQETVLLEYQGGINYKATAYFTVPGTYVLKSLWVDGSEYALPAPLTVVVDGFAVQSTQIVGSTMVMTSNESVTRQVLVSFGNTLNPKSVSARFTYGNNQNITEKLTWDGVTWSGSFTFKDSGTYTLTGLILDNEHYDIPEGQQKKIVVNLGMYTEIVSLSLPEDIEDLDSTDNINFLFNRPLDIGVQVMIYNKEGHPQEALQNVVLAYANESYSNVEDGSSTNLTWNGRYYVGTLPIEEPGAYYYALVKVAVSPEEGAAYESITQAKKKPTIDVISPEPPDLDENSVTPGGLIITQGVTDAKFSLSISHAPSAQNIFAVMADGTLITAKVGANGFDFVFPKNSVDSQNGSYTLTELRLYNVFVDGERYYKDAAEGVDKPFIIDVADETYNVLDELNVTTQDHSISGGSFMQAQSLITTVTTTDGKITYNGIRVTPFVPEKDILGNTFNYTEFVKIKSMELVLEYIGGSELNGGYTIPTLDANDAGYATLQGYKKLTLQLADTNGDGIYEVVSGDSAYLAGTYNFKSLKITVQDKTNAVYTRDYTYNDLDLGSHKLTLQSVKPTVTIDSIAPNKPHASMKPSGDRGESVNVESKIDGNTIYLYCESSNSGWNYIITTYPRATLKISMGAAQRAEMRFGEEVRLYTGQGTGQTDYFVWEEGSNTCTRYVGYFKDGRCGSGATITGAGEISASSVTLIHNEIKYTVEVAAITINNPH